MKKTIKVLYGQVKALNAGQAHFKADHIFGDEEANAVISVYIGERPSNEVLDDLVEWAEGNKNQELLDKIQNLAELTRWTFWGKVQ